MIRNLPTVIVVHPNEKRSKCTAELLRGREGFSFWNHPVADRPDLDGYVRLWPGGQLLGSEDRDRGLLILDGSWRHAARMMKDYEDLPLRALPAWKTAYPRVSKLYRDPPLGLATIEAVYLAFEVLGRDSAGLLDGYRWAPRFLELNRDSNARLKEQHL